MRDLTTVGLSDDGAHVVLRSVSGEEFQVPIDDRLRATVRNDRARLGQLEVEMDSALRPRDIQARIRRGESPAAVAESADVSVDKIMGYAVPVIAEREHVVERARGSTIRRRHSQTSAMTLGEAVDAALRDRGQDPSAATWDSWRREDGRWTVAVHTGESGGPATPEAQYTFDAPGRFVTAEDEASRELVGDVVPGPDSTDMAIAAAVSDHAPAEADVEDTGQPADDEPGVTSLRRARARRALAAQEQLSFDHGEDATYGQDPGGSAEDAVSARDTSEPSATIDRAPAERGEPADAGLTPADTDAGPEAGSVTGSEEKTGEGSDPPARKPRSGKRRERRRVPSWDEIMFGDKNS